MFHHVKELQFNARVSKPDPKFATLLLEQFGGANGELKAAMQYFVQAFSCRQPYPDKYDMLMDIATEEFSHLEIVGATIQMLLGPVPAEMKDASNSKDLEKGFESSGLAKLVTGGKAGKEGFIHEAMSNPLFLTEAPGPQVTNSVGVPWSGYYVNANADLTVDLRSNIAAESRAKIVYEYLMQFTDDPLVKESLSFLMTREITHMQVFTAALETVQPNFPPGILQGDSRYLHVYTNMSNGASARGPWKRRPRTVVRWRAVAIRFGSHSGGARVRWNAEPASTAPLGHGRSHGREAQQDAQRRTEPSCAGWGKPVVFVSADLAGKPDV